MNINYFVLSYGSIVLLLGNGFSLQAGEKKENNMMTDDCLKKFSLFLDKNNSGDIHQEERFFIKLNREQEERFFKKINEINSSVTLEDIIRSWGKPDSENIIAPKRNTPNQKTINLKYYLRKKVKSSVNEKFDIYIDLNFDYDSKKLKSIFFILGDVCIKEFKIP